MVEERLQLVLGADKFARRERLEDDGGGPGRLEPELRLERDARGRKREELLAGGVLQLPASEEDVGEPHEVYSTGRPISRESSARRARRFSSGGWVANSSPSVDLTPVGMMKNAFIASTERRSR